MNLNELLENIESYWHHRKNEMIKRWDFYYGDPQRMYLPRFPGEDDYEYVSRQDSATIENHCGKTCDVLVGYLYGQPNCQSRIKVRALDDNGNIVESIQKLLQHNIWRNNDIDSFRIDVALMVSVTGYAVIHKEFVDKRTMLPFDKKASKEDKKKYGTIRYDLFDSVDTMPIPKISETGEIYPRLLGSIIRMYSTDNYSGNRYIDRINNKRYTVENRLEAFDDKEFRRLIITDGVLDRNTDTKSSVSEPNPYGDIRVPFTVFRNYGDPMYLEGESDIANMISLQSALNEVTTDDKATISYHSFPVLTLNKGAKLPSNFVRKVNSVLEFDGDGTAEYLTWDNVLEASAKFKEEVRTNMTVVSGVSQLSRGNASGVGQVRSGAGLKTLFQADVNCISLKIPHFKKAEKELVYSTIKMWEFETGESFGDFTCEVEFPEDFVGLDKLINAQTEQIELTQGVESLREVIKETHPEFTSEAEVDAYYGQIMKEKQKIAEMEAKAKAKAVPKVPGTQSSEAKSQAQQ